MSIILWQLCSMMLLCHLIQGENPHRARSRAEKLRRMLLRDQCRPLFLLISPCDVPTEQCMPRYVCMLRVHRYVADFAPKTLSLLTATMLLTAYVLLQSCHIQPPNSCDTVVAPIVSFHPLYLCCHPDLQHTRVLLSDYTVTIRLWGTKVRLHRI